MTTRIEYTADRDDRPMWTDDAAAVAYRAGYTRALTLIAERVAELDACWTAVRSRTHAEQVAERVAEMQACAAQLAAEMGRPPGWVYRGGPVDWRTGRTRRRLEAAA